MLADYRLLHGHYMQLHACNDHVITCSCMFYAIRNETTSGGSAIKTIQQQNDIGVVRAPKGEQNSSVEKGRPTTVQSLNFKKSKI